MANNTKLFCCIDCSGSTHMSSFYWSNVSNIVNTLTNSRGNSFSEVIFIFWDHRAIISNEAEVKNRCYKKEGGTSTVPSSFIPYLKNDCHLIIITDGQVQDSEVEMCDKLIGDLKFSRVEIQFFGSRKDMNLSVSAPFTRSTSFKLVINNECISMGDSRINFDLKQYWNSPEKFVTEFDEIFKSVLMKNLGIQNVKLKDEILELQKNLMKSIRANGEEFNFNELRKLLNNESGADNHDDYQRAIELVNTFLDSEKNALARNIELQIQSLLKISSGLRDYSFDLLDEPSRIRRANNVENIREDDITSVSNYFGKFECPILLDNDIPVCLIKQGNPIFEGLTSSEMNSYLSSPLLTLCNPILVQKIKDRLDHIIGLNAAKKLFGGSYQHIKSPMTRSALSSFICLGDHATHTKATNQAMANLFFGKKLVGMSEMWLSVLYFVIEQISYIKNESNFMDLYKERLVKRIQERESAITLSVLSIDPMINAPLDIAIWYCVNSASLLKFREQEDSRNRLRSFGPAAQYLVKLLDILGYSYDRDWVLHRLALYKAFTYMMNQEKSENSEWRTILRAQYQKSILLQDGTCVMLDGEVEEGDEKPEFPKFSILNGPTLTINEIVTLSKLVDKDKKTGLVLIPKDFKGEELKITINYDYPETPMKLPEICQYTLRPFSYDRQSKLYWKESALKISPLSKQLSCFKYFIQYTRTFGKYPTRDEYLEYVSKCQKSKGIDTLPAQMLHFLDLIFIDYFKNYIGNLSVTNYISITEESREILDRISMENQQFQTSLCRRRKCYCWINFLSENIQDN